jgi:hypothetical protein
MLIRRQECGKEKNEPTSGHLVIAHDDGSRRQRQILLALLLPALKIATTIGRGTEGLQPVCVRC